MDRQEKEQWIDKLLIFMNDKIEEKGIARDRVVFNFRKDGVHYARFNHKYTISYDDILTIINTSISRGLCLYSEKTLAISDTGCSRALKISLEKEIRETPKPSIHIDTVNTNGNTQIGNHNTQNIEILFNELIEKIDDADAPEEQKEEAKSRLNSFLEHPLVGTLFGTGMQALFNL